MPTNLTCNVFFGVNICFLSQSDVLFLLHSCSIEINFYFACHSTECQVVNLIKIPKAISFSIDEMGGIFRA